MRNYKCFVSYIKRDGKRVWRLFRADSIRMATDTINLIAERNLQISYVRIERL